MRSIVQQYMVHILYSILIRTVQCTSILICTVHYTQAHKKYTHEGVFSTVHVHVRSIFFCIVHCTHLKKAHILYRCMKGVRMMKYCAPYLGHEDDELLCSVLRSEDDDIAMATRTNAHIGGNKTYLGELRWTKITSARSTR